MSACRKCREHQDTLLTEAEVLELLANGGRLEGYWAVTVQVPTESNPFTTDKSWLDVLNQLTEMAGVKITSLKFNLNANVESYVFGLRED